MFKMLMQLFLTVGVIPITLGGCSSDSAETKKQYIDINDFSSSVVFFGGYPLYDREIYAIAKNDEVKLVEASVEWSDLQKGKGEYDFSVIDKMIDIWSEAGKKVDLRVMTANTGVFSSPKELMIDKGIRMIAGGYYTDFEKPTKYFDFNGTVQEITEAIGKGKGLYFTNSSDSDAIIIESTSSQEFISNEEYMLQFDYYALEDGKYYVEYTDGTENGTKRYCFDAQKGDSGFKQYLHTIGNGELTKIKIGIQGQGSILIDNVHIVKSTNTDHDLVGYPNYFSNEFREEFEEFVKELGKRYNDNDDVYAVTVAGIGRWEEAILNVVDIVSNRPEDNDFVIRQWKALGFTEEKYFEHIKWAIELHKKYLPNKELKLQVSPIFHGYENQDIANRRIAQICNDYGVHIKQNGMSEMNDAWDPESHVSYTFNKYRYDKDSNIKITYETGGQLYNNFVNAMGHPISLLNRILIDGASYMYLYGVDLLEPNVAKYLHYAEEELSSPLFTKMYNRLGDYSLVNQHSGTKVNYYNNWLGIRQFNTNTANVTYTVKEGEKCILTGNGMNGNNSVVFDIDNKRQYFGMTGSTLSIEYFDEGTDSFEITVLDEKTDEFESIGTVAKTNTNEWKIVSFFNESFTDSYKNLKEDHINLIINDMSDGAEYIKSVELDSVPLRDYADSIIFSNHATQDYLTVQDMYETTFNLESEGISMLSIPLFTDGSLADRNEVEVTLYKKINDSWIRASKKRLYLFKDKELIYLPIMEYENSNEYKVCVERKRGNVGIYLGEDKNISYNAHSFDVEEAVLHDNEFFIDKPFTSINITTASEDTQLIKILPDGTEALVAKSNNTNNNTKWYFPPQTSGKYKLLNSTGDKIYLLKRAVASTTPREVKVGDNILEDKFNNNTNDWRAYKNIAELKANKGVLSGVITGSYPSIYKEGLNINAEGSHYLEMTIMNETPAGLVRVYWASEDEEFSGEKSMLIPIVSNDEKWRYISFPIGREANYSGTVNKIMIEPASGIMNSGTIRIKRIALTDKTTFAKWDFKNQYDMFLDDFGNAIGTIKDDKYFLEGKQISFGTNGDFLPNFNEIAGKHKIVVSLKNLSDANRLAVSWKSKDKNESATDNKIGWQYVDIEPNSNSFQTYEIDLLNDNKWKDIIVNLKFALNNKMDGNVEIDYIYITK